MATRYYLLDRLPVALLRGSTLGTERVELTDPTGVVTLSETGCWTWDDTTPGEYGKIRHEGESERVHHLAYRLAVGPVPVGHELAHRCANRRCWNPEHLRLVAPGEHLGPVPAKPGPKRAMPDDVWVVASRMSGEFRAVEFHRLVTVLPYREETAIQTAHRWLRRDPRVIKTEYAKYRVEQP